MTTIRDAVSADHALICAWNDALARESEDKALDAAALSAGVRRVLDDPKLGRYFIADIGGEPAGQMMLTWEWSDWRNGMFWWIQSVYVAPPFRSQGVFRALYGHVEGLARTESAVAGLRLYVHDGNKSAIEVYRRLGMDDGHYRVMETLFGFE
ncbi:MAG: GNAT family N-acetyltransferase [Xanthomonadaceae bacterium]|nr:GNAT family N-acetyltransferase [Xanthomonadaceae bacterium]